MMIGPLLGAATLNADIMTSETQYPNLLTLDSWKTFKYVTWTAYLCVAALSFYAGYGFATYREFTAVRRAKIILWVAGPAATVVIGMLIPLVVFGTFKLDPVIIGHVIPSAIGAAIWTAYLSRSKRVRATYASSPSEAATVTPRRKTQ